LPPHIRVLSGGSPCPRGPKAGPYAWLTLEQFTTGSDLLEASYMGRWCQYPLF
jgi:hypothetical protein